MHAAVNIINVHCTVYTDTHTSTTTHKHSHKQTYSNDSPRLPFCKNQCAEEKIITLYHKPNSSTNTAGLYGLAEPSTTTTVYTVHAKP